MQKIVREKKKYPMKLCMWYMDKLVCRCIYQSTIHRVLKEIETSFLKNAQITWAEIALKRTHKCLKFALNL